MLDPIPPSRAVFPCKMCFLGPSVSWGARSAGLNAGRAYLDRGQEDSLQAVLCWNSMFERRGVRKGPWVS